MVYLSENESVQVFHSLFMSVLTLEIQLSIYQYPVKPHHFCVPVSSQYLDFPLVYVVVFRCVHLFEMRGSFFCRVLMNC